MVGFGDVCLFAFFLLTSPLSCAQLCAMTEINIEFMRFNTTNSSAIQWVKLIITSYYVCTLFWHGIARCFAVRISKNRWLYKYSRFRRWFLPFVCFIIFAIGNEHIVSRKHISLFSCFVSCRQRRERTQRNENITLWMNALVKLNANQQYQLNKGKFKFVALLLPCAHWHIASWTFAISISAHISNGLCDAWQKEMVKEMMMSSIFNVN